VILNDNDRSQLLTRRSFVVGGLMTGLLGLLVGRLYYLQVLQSSHYTTLAEENRINARLLAPQRGQILDRNGVPLATNQQNFRAVLIAEQAKDRNAVLERFSSIIALTETEQRRIQRDLKRNRSFMPILLRDNLLWDDVAKLEINTPDLPGVLIEMGDVRSYPFGAVASHIIGYVGSVPEEDADGDPLLSMPGFRIGRNGAERQFDSDLRGEAGASELEVNAHGRVVRELSREDGTPGKDVTLTIDIGLQQYAYERLKEETSAAAVVVDVHTGGIYAMVSSPGYDPNLFPPGISSADWKSLLDNPATPLLNKPIAGQYAPGSTVKTVVALAALESGMVDANHRVTCTGHMELGNHRFHCWRKEGHGTLDMVGGLMNSCDIYFYDIAKKMGIDRIQAMAKRFGLGDKLGIDLPHERPGLFPSRAWKSATKKGSWQQGETLVAAIGQGYVLATPLQLAVMAARLANGGYAVEPHLLKKDGGGKTAKDLWPGLGISPSHLAVVLTGMNEVMNNPRGTAFAARIKEEGMEMAGKTGTSQVRRISMAEREGGVITNDRLPWKDRDHALFIGIAPVASPRYAVSVIVEHGGGGSKVAAPIARDILLECQKRNISG
jgi:penicillin-binding protein 2